MAEPARKRPEDGREPDREPWADEEDRVMLQRWVEQPDGHFELVELPLTPELYLNPQLEDKMTQGKVHANLMRDLAELLSRYFNSQPDVLVLMDHKHLLGPGLPGPGPDVSVIRGIHEPEQDRLSFDVVEEGVLPCLIIEIVSPRDRRVREMDEKDKFLLYQRVGIPEYVLIYPPGRATSHRFFLKGYRLGPEKLYVEIAPDAKGRILSQTAGLKLGVAKEGKGIELFNARTGKRLETPLELEAAHKVERAARKAAEAELKRLRAEVERLKKRGR